MALGSDRATATRGGRGRRRIAAVLVALACAVHAPAASAAKPDSLLDIPALLDDGQYERVLALARPEIAHPRLAEGTSLADLCTIAVLALSHVVEAEDDGTGHDAEVARLYDTAVGNAPGDAVRLSAARKALALYYGNSGRPGRAVPLWLENLAFQRRQGDKAGQAAALSSLAATFNDAGMSARRDQYRREGLEILEGFLGPKIATTPEKPAATWRADMQMLLDAVSEATDTGDAARIAGYEPRLLAINEAFGSPRFVAYFELAKYYAIAGDGQRSYSSFDRGRRVFLAERAGMDAQAGAAADASIVCTRASIDQSMPRPQAVHLMDYCLNALKAEGLMSLGTDLQAGLVYESGGATHQALERYRDGIARLRSLRGSYTVAERRSFMNLPVAQGLYAGRLRALLRTDNRTNWDGGFFEAFAAADEYRARQLGELVGAGGDGSAAAFRAYVGALPPGVLLLGLTVMADRTVVMAVDDKGYRFKETSLGAAAMAKQVRALLTQLADPQSPAGPLMRSLKAYSARLLGDVRPMLAGHTQIIVALDGPAALLPPALLFADDATDTPIGLQADVSATPAFRFLTRPRGDGRAGAFMAVGDPAYPKRLRVADVPAEDVPDGAAPGGGLRTLAGSGVSVPPLPETRDEVVAIAQLFPGESRVLLGVEATTSAVRRADFSRVRYLHLATHGLLAGDLVGLTEPALVLAAEPEGDALLRSSDAEKLKLDNVELTVLSACNTGSGQVYSGEGVMGLSRAFLAAGSHAVIVSMWPVASRQTETLMVDFYRRRRSGLSLEASLRAAMADIRRSDPHPMFWAPFVLIRVG